ncbi:MAG: CYTH domain-containing protein [Clostridia bacterium]|nr:CYTH domain-containing protein [Clostridia bacterium]
MGKMELEVKVLNINEKEIIKKIEQLGGKLVSKGYQYIYTYDLPTIYSRYVDILILLNNNESEAKKQTAISKLKLLFFEIDNLLTEENKKEIKSIIGMDNFTDLLKKDNFEQIMNNEKIIEFVKKFHTNPKKWIRVRQTNRITTLTVKHILADNGTKIQQMLETEMIVPSMKEANDFLEALGYSHKCYEEKKRITYKLNEHIIDIDTWPQIPTYMEIEGKDEKDLEETLKLLGYCMKDTVSCTADEIYINNGIDVLNMRELKF